MIESLLVYYKNKKYESIDLNDAVIIKLCASCQQKETISTSRYKIQGRWVGMDRISNSSSILFI